MASGAVHTLVMARLASVTGAQLYGPNELSQPPANGGAYVLVMYPVASEEQATVGAPGSNRFREEGSIRFVVHVPRDTGANNAFSLCDQIRTLFRNYKASGLRCFESTPAITNEDLDDEAYFIVSSSVAYQYDILA